MKKVTEKDLSLDKQEVSYLGGSTGTKEDTVDGICATLGNNCTKSEDFNCKTNEDACNLTINSNTCRCTINCHDSNLCNLTNSAFEVCCDKTYKNCPPAYTVNDTCTCPVTDDSLCDVCSNTPGCMTPTTDTRFC